jgi:hypothetical protein
MRAPSVARQIHLYSVSVHMSLSRSRITVATAVIIFPVSSGKVIARWHVDSIVDGPRKDKS